MTDRWARRGDDGGSGTVLVLALIGVVLVLLSGVLALGSAAVARHQAEAAADLAALAAVDRGCDRAAAVAAADGGALTACQPLADGSYVVRVSVPPARGTGYLRALGHRFAVGVARAGPGDLVGGVDLCAERGRRRGKVQVPDSGGGCARSAAESD